MFSTIINSINLIATKEQKATEEEGDEDGEDDDED
jgi:hypothetical protein